MRRKKYTEAIKTRIEKSQFGSVFVISDFSDIADTDIVRKALTRIESQGLISRIIRGVYYKPEYNTLLNENVAPSPDNVAHAIARNYGWTIVPCGDSALNYFGLCAQVPSQWIYVSDGAYKDYTYDNTDIRFKKAANKDLSKLSYKTAITIQAIKSLGEENVNDHVIAQLRKVLSDDEKAKMIVEAKSSTAWVYGFIKEICMDKAV